MTPKRGTEIDTTVKIHGSNLVTVAVDVVCLVMPVRVRLIIRGGEVVTTIRDEPRNELGRNLPR
jgi:hypothetical protein